MRTEYYNNILCVEAGWLVEIGVISKSNYDQQVARGFIKVLRRACKGTPALVEYNSIPQRFKDIIVEKYGDPTGVTPASHFSSYIKPDIEALSFFETYVKPDGTFLKSVKINEYYTNVILLNAIRDVLNSRRAMRKALGGKTTGLWLTVARVVNELDRTKYPHSLPANERALKRRYEAYLKHGYECIIHGGMGTRNAAKIDDDVKESLLTELLADPRNLDNEQIARLYNMTAEPLCWKKISASAVGVWRDKLELITYAGRRGATEHANRKAMQHKRSKPTHPLYFWSVDGWDVELLYQETKVTEYKDKNGDIKEKTITTYHNRLTVVVVLDPCVNYPIGYAIGTHENPLLIKEALRNAANHTAELFGQRYKALQLQSDRYAIKALTPIYNTVAKKVTPATVRNAKAKPVERYFLSLNKKYCQLMPNWSGFGVASKKDSQPNTEFLNKYKHNFPTIEGCREQIARIIEMERSSKVKRYMELWQGIPAEHKLPLTTENYLYAFGASTGHKNLLQGSGINIKINGITQSFDCFDLSFREHASVRWTVLFDPDNLSEALAVNDEGTLRYTLQNKYVQPMALIERNEGDKQAKQLVDSFNRELTEFITDSRAESGEKVRELFENNPQLENTLTKLVLTDSMGQHKNQRNRRRKLQAETINIEEIEPTLLVKNGNKVNENQEIDIYSMM